MSDSTSQPSSRAAKSGKFASLSRAIKYSGFILKFFPYRLPSSETQGQLVGAGKSGHNPFSSPEAAILLVSYGDRDLWQIPLATQRSNECACSRLSTSGLFPVPRCSARSIKFNMLRNFCESNIAGNLFFVR